MISIIIPVYKVEKYLNRCIDSVINQTYRNIEIILVDDGSPDNCPEICNEYAAKDSRIRVIHQKNAGLSAARNAGLDIAQGDYIGFVDSDDYIHPEMYERLLNAIEFNHADIALCNFQYVNEIGKIIYKFSPLKNEIMDSNTALDKLEESYGVYYVVAWNRLYKRELFKQVRFPVGKQHEDEAIAHIIYNNAKKIVAIDDELYYYVQREGSIMADMTIRSLDIIEVFNERISYYLEHNYKERILKNAQRLLGFYERRRINVHCKNILEKKRKKEIDTIAFNVYKKYIPQKNWNNQLKYRFPDAYFFAKKCKAKFVILVFILQYICCQFGKKYILIDTPIHGNLGDHAIVLAEQQFMENLCINRCTYEVTANTFDRYKKWLPKLTFKNRDILVHGGGFLGVLWPLEEYRFRDILNAFSKHRIIVFPQTVTFDMKTDNGRGFFEESKAAYEAHPNLTIFVRETKSYAFMKEYMPNVHCYMVPDIVATLKVNIVKAERHGVLFCMRRDLEKDLSDKSMEYIKSCIQKHLVTEQITFTDTVLEHTVQPNERQQEVNKKLQQFAEAKLVITDRLHGMIFAMLTRTPCIVFSNSNGKVKAVYEWIKSLPYVQFVESVEMLETRLKEMDLNREYDYNPSFLDSAFSKLVETIKERGRP